jgi:hypothetical protein
VQKEFRSAEPGLTRRGLFKSGLVVGLGAAGLTAASAAIADYGIMTQSMPYGPGIERQSGLDEQ